MTEIKPTIVMKHTGKSWNEWIMKIFQTDQVILTERSLYLFGVENGFRKKCATIVSRPQFEMLILFTIAVSSIVLIWDEPGLDQDSSTFKLLYWINAISLLIFYLEAIMKIISFGLIQTDDGYLRDKWNWIDIAAIVFGTLDLFVGNLAFLKVVRAFRAFRVIRRVEGMRVVSVALFQSLKPVANVCAVAALFFFVFGIVGVQLYRGRFNQCSDESNTVTADDRASCQATDGLKWGNPTFGHFDHIGAALLILFEVSTLEGWPDIMYRAASISGRDAGPVAENEPYQALFFILFIICTNFFIMNLFVGVVIDHFNQAKQNLEGGLLTPQVCLFNHDLVRCE